MAGTVEESYRHCRQVARSRAKNFYYSFLLLDKTQRDAMCAVYAFNRYCDDLSDDPSASSGSAAADRIREWRMDLHRALHGDFDRNIIWPAFHDTVQRYNIPHRYFYEMIDGVSSDLEARQIETFDELRRYCYQVASVVGLTIVHIFGYQSVKALLLAEKCGIAFQLTNILRDVREDAARSRVYLPREDLDRYGVKVDELRSATESKNFRQLMQFEAARAWEYYRESAPLAQFIDERSRPSLWALREIYQRLLRRIEMANYSVLSRRINVPTHTKLGLLLKAFMLKPSGI
jgi:15-cis-phytoene synthase